MRKIGYVSGRLAAIDELRALAIMSMMLAHFGPGTLERLPGMVAFTDAILFWGRFATVMFITVFGITIGFVHYERFYSSDRAKTVSSLNARTRLVLICAIIIHTPVYVEWLAHGPVKFPDILYYFYSVLNFYVLGFLSVPYWLMALGQHPLRNAFLLGLGHWAAATLLLAIWPYDPAQGVVEYIRMHLVSGPYAYLQLAGSVLMAIPVGVYLRKALVAGTSPRFIFSLMPLGLALTAGGWAIGHWLNEFDVHAIVAGTVKTPPRLWYWMFFMGPTLWLLAGLVILELRVAAMSKFLYPLALFGMAALPIYTVHTFVLPSLKVLDTMIVIEGIGRIVLPFAVFAVYCLIVMQYYHGKLRDRLVTSSA